VAPQGWRAAMATRSAWAARRERSSTSVVATTAPPARSPTATMNASTANSEPHRAAQELASTDTNRRVDGAYLDALAAKAREDRRVRRTTADNLGQHCGDVSVTFSLATTR
jgi:hypothetical protein